MIFSHHGPLTSWRYYAQQRYCKICSFAIYIRSLLPLPPKGGALEYSTLNPILSFVSTLGSSRAVCSPCWFLPFSWSSSLISVIALSNSRNEGGERERSAERFLTGGERERDSAFSLAALKSAKKRKKTGKPSFELEKEQPRVVIMQLYNTESYL